MKAAALLPDVVLQPHQQRVADEAARGPIRKLLYHGLGSGKCVRGDTPVVVNGRLVEIATVFPTVAAGVAEEWLPAPNMKTVSWNGSDALVSRRVLRLYRQRLPDCERTYVVETARGNRIECTGQHKLLVVGQGKPSWRPAALLQQGDRVAMAATLPSTGRGKAISDSLVELLTWQVTEGYENADTSAMTITQDNLQVLERVRQSFLTIAASEGWATTTGHIRVRREHCPYIDVHCRAYRDYLEMLGYPWGQLSAGRAVPDWFVGLPQRQVILCLRTWLHAEGHVGKGNVEVTSASLKLSQQLQYLLLRVGVRSSLHSRRGRATNGKKIWRTYWRVSVSGYDAEILANVVGASCPVKHAALVSLAGKVTNPNYGIPFADIFQRLRGYGLQGLTLRAKCKLDAPKESVSPATARNIAESLRSALRGGLPPCSIKGAGHKWRERTRVNLTTYRDETAQILSEIDSLLTLPFAYEPVKSIVSGDSGGWVYDLEVDATVDDHHCYVAGTGGFICHNTLSSVAAMEARDEPYSAVVPAALRPNYRSEAEKFTDRTTPLPVSSYTSLALGDQPPPGNLVFDEVQRLRSPASAQTQAAIAAAEKAKSLLLLSGTPVVNRPGDLAVPLQLLTGKKMSPDEFEGRYTGTRRTYPSLLHRLVGWSSGSEPTLRRRRELEALLAGHVDYYAPASPTVPVRYEDHAVDMSEPQVQLYRGMLDQLPHHLKRQLRSSVDPADEDLPRLMAFLTGPRQVGLSTLPFRRDKDPLKAFDQSPKLQAAMAKMTEHLADPRKKALVFSNFIDAGLTPYAAALGRAGVPHAVFHGGLSDAERKKLVADYNSGAIRAALIGPSGTEGLSFKGTQLIQMLDPHWQPTRAAQAEGRGLRFDSHTGLPEDLRHVTVQRFASRLPAGMAGRLARATGFGQPEVDRRLTAMSDRKTRANRLILDLLQRVGTPKAAGVLDELKRAKTESDRKNYPAKHEILRRLMKESPADFAVDSRAGHLVGVTHAPTGFRFHLPATAVPGDPP